MIFRLQRVVMQYLKNYRRRRLSKNRNTYLKKKKNVAVKLSEQPEFIISLTSIPNRFKTLALVIESLSKQELPANEIHLNLAHQDFSDLPNSIRAKLDQSKMKVFSVDDLGPAKKLIPSLQRSDLQIGRAHV